MLIDHFGGWAFGIALAATAVIGTYELYRMLSEFDSLPWSPAGLFASALLAGWPVTARVVPRVVGGIIVLLIVLSAMYAMRPPRFDTALHDWFFTVVPPLYVGLLLGHLGFLRTINHGAWWVVLALLITWAYDTGAYFAGSRYGKRPFMSHVSPSKTFEGVTGGLLCAAVASLAALPTIGLAVWQAVLLGLVGGAVGQAGDLTESMIKRSVGVKDSGALVPGHGGLLDRIDGLLYVAPFVAYGAMIFGYAA